FNMLPSMTRAWRQDRQAFVALINSSLRGVAWLGMAGGLIWVVMAPVAMTSVYGSAFAPAGATLQCLAAVCVVAALSGPYPFGLISTGRQNAEAATAALGATAAAISIPFGYAEFGLRGAAMGLLVAETTVWISAWRRGRQLLGLKDHAKLLLRPALALILVSTWLWALPIYSAVARAAIGGASMITLALACDVEARRLATTRALWLWRRLNRSALEAA